MPEAGQTPLWWAALFGNGDILKFLLAAKADPAKADAEGVRQSCVITCALISSPPEVGKCHR
jgi:ankyrin repeat protein